jgi:hypothetical protein
MGKSTVSMAIFNSFFTNYQRVIPPWRNHRHLRRSRTTIAVSWKVFTQQTLGAADFVSGKLERKIKSIIP